MTHVNKTNRFFKDKAYPNLCAFALSPVSWAFKPVWGDSFAVPHFGKLLVAALLAPVLVPATIVTSAIALCLIGISALLHGLSLMVAKIADCFSNTGKSVAAQPVLA
jgi:hypothetical protein